MTPFKLFKVKPEERVQAVVVLTVIVILNALFIYRMHDLFMQPGFGPYWKAFERELHLSGYDPLTYLGVTDWDVVYQVYRHPLLSFLIWPFWLLNQGLTALFGVNCVQYIVALPVMACSFYSYIFLYRIHREVIELERWDATLLTAYYFSFAYILLSVIVPDHFTISMFLLLITLYISGVCIKKGREFRWWQSAILFYITAGVTLSNGIKVFLSGFFVNLRDFFRPKYLLLAVILPAALLWGTATWEYQQYVLPKEKVRAELKVKKAEELKARVAQMTDKEKEQFEKRKAKRQEVLRRQAAKTGKPMENHGFLKWTDISTSRWQSVYENLFGESVQFHQQHFLEDTLVHRPVFVPYDWIWSYVVETVVVLLFIVGIWCGRRSRFLWLCLSCFGFDMFIHLILGFGLNEVFIMAPHFMFVLPIATAFLFQQNHGDWHNDCSVAKIRVPVPVILRLTLLLLTLYLFIYNGYLLTSFLLSPIHAII
ncbi:MAG: GtrA family protein [Prevotella sp.]|nr:GtrA family protein [Prevotella sp.]